MDEGVDMQVEQAAGATSTSQGVQALTERGGGGCGGELESVSGAGAGAGAEDSVAQPMAAATPATEAGTMEAGGSGGGAGKGTTVDSPQGSSSEQIALALSSSGARPVQQAPLGSIHGGGTGVVKGAPTMYEAAEPVVVAPKKKKAKKDTVVAPTCNDAGRKLPAEGIVKSLRITYDMEGKGKALADNFDFYIPAKLQVEPIAKGLLHRSVRLRKSALLAQQLWVMTLMEAANKSEDQVVKKHYKRMKKKMLEGWDTVALLKLIEARAVSMGRIHVVDGALVASPSSR